MAIQIQLTQGQVALIDDWEFERVSQIKWHTYKDPRTGRYYARGRVDGREVWLHRFILNAPSDMEVDHIDHDGLNCQRYNMRLATHAQNQTNRGKQKNNASGYKGVSLEKRCGRYRAQITHEKIYYFLGYHDAPEDAARAYDAKARELHGEFAVLNFPNET
jgi:hypothetical protein